MPGGWNNFPVYNKKGHGRQGQGKRTKAEGQEKRAKTEIRAEGQGEKAKTETRAEGQGKRPRTETDVEGPGERPRTDTRGEGQRERSWKETRAGRNAKDREKVEEREKSQG